MKTLLTLILAACLGACSGQESHTVIFTNRAEFIAHQDGNTMIIDSTLFCGPESAILKFTRAGITISNERGTVEVPIIKQLESGVFLLESGDSVPIILHIFEDRNRDYIMYFHKRDIITRFSTTIMPCDEL